jgi:hypothetical protein
MARAKRPPKPTAYITIVDKYSTTRLVFVVEQQSFVIGHEMCSNNPDCAAMMDLMATSLQFALQKIGAKVEIVPSSFFGDRCL